MFPNRKLLAATTLALCSALAAAAQVERSWLKYGEVAELYEKFESIAPEQRRGLQFRLRLDPNTPQPAGALRLFVQDKARRAEVAQSGEGVIELPRDAQWRRDDPQLVLEAPAGVKVGLAVEVLIDLPQPGSSRRYADWMHDVQAAASGMRKHAGFWALFMPKPEGLELRYPAGTAATARLGGTVWQVDEKGRLVVPQNVKQDENLPLELSSPPLLARPYFKTSITLMPSGESAAK
ncbi:hypothetical protein ACG04Q_24600 [Roseateles sp. DXS20W]|uniref:DUF2987 domain-containing protein n=1 Tax=Pelomonas lactea TaxID=3299030 RepID=A0ABW7GST8_9BURK